jgi:type II secretory pathway pseudopilin PulG
MIRQTSRYNGFTILELLIAAGITTVIVVFLGVMFGSLSTTAARANQRVDAFREARAAIQLMERDFAALVRAPGTAYFASDGDLSNGNGSQARHLCALISLKNKPAGNPAPIASDVCSVAYYCGWDGALKSYRLHRYFRDSAATFNNIQTAFSKSSPAYAGVGNLYQLGTDDVVAGNCWNLVVTAYDASGNVLNPQPYPNGGQTTGLYVCDPSAGATGALPAAIEVSFKAMSANAARAAVTAGAGPDAWMAPDETGASTQDKQLYNRLIAPHVYQFRTRITLLK